MVTQVAGWCGVVVSIASLWGWCSKLMRIECVTFGILYYSLFNGSSSPCKTHATICFVSSLELLYLMRISPFPQCSFFILTMIMTYQPSSKLYALNSNDDECLAKNKKML